MDEVNRSDLPPSSYENLMQKAEIAAQAHNEEDNWNKRGWSLPPIAFEPTKKNMVEASLIGTGSSKEPREESGDLVPQSQLEASMWELTSK